MLTKKDYQFYKDYYFGLVYEKLSDDEQLIINKLDYYLKAKIPTDEFEDEAKKCGGLEAILLNSALINFYAKIYNVSDEDLIKIRIKQIIKEIEQKKTR